MKPGDVVTVPYEAKQPWEEWKRSGKVIIVAPPYCVVVIDSEDEGYHTERVTCRIDQVRIEEE